MSVTNGELANQNTFNTSFMSREVDTDTVGKVDLLNPAAPSGPSVLNIQRFANSIASMLGISTAEVYNFLYSWPNNYVGSINDTVLQRVNALIALFDGTSGHDHDGTNGKSKKISASNLLDINQFLAYRQAVDIVGANGTTYSITTEMSGKTPGGSSSSLGVITSPPNNRVYIKDSLTETFVEDAEGQRVYGRITESGGAWTLSFYTNEGGVETAHNLSTLNISIYFWEVFNLATRPTIPSDPAEFGTLDITGDVSDASDTIRGVLNPTLSPQILGGDKSWNGEQFFNLGTYFLGDVYLDLENDNTTSGSNQTIAQGAKVVKRLSNVGLTSIKGHDIVGVESEIRILINKTGNVIDVLHDSDTVTGFMLPNNSTFKFKSNSAILIHYNLIDERWHIIGGAGGSDFNLQAFGSTPNANGATYNSLNGNFNLQPADSTNPGGFQYGGTQLFPEGDKSFVHNVGFGLSVNSSLNGSSVEIVGFNQTHLIVTNALLLSIASIGKPSGSQSWIKFLTNDTGNEITIKDETGTTATERIRTGTNADFKLKDKSTILLIYDNNINRWTMIGGGGGSSGFVTSAVQNIASGGTFTISLTEKFQLLKAKNSASGGTAVLSSTPFGSTAPSDGALFKVVCTSDTDRIQIDNNDAAKGCILNGSANMGAYNMIEFIYDATLDRYVECSRNF